MIEKKPFVRYELDDNKKDQVISTKFNPDDIKKLILLQNLLQQEQPSTAIKQSIDIALEVLLNQKNLVVLKHVLNNYRRNKRKGVVTYDDTDYQKYIKSNMI